MIIDSIDLSWNQNQHVCLYILFLSNHIFVINTAGHHLFIEWILHRLSIIRMHINQQWKMMFVSHGLILKHVASLHRVSSKHTLTSTTYLWIETVLCLFIENKIDLKQGKCYIIQRAFWPSKKFLLFLHSSKSISPFH